MLFILQPGNRKDRLLDKYLPHQYWKTRRSSLALRSNYDKWWNLLMQTLPFSCLAQYTVHQLQSPLGATVVLTDVWTLYQPRIKDFPAPLKPMRPAIIPDFCVQRRTFLVPYSVYHISTDLLCFKLCPVTPSGFYHIAVFDGEQDSPNTARIAAALGRCACALTFLHSTSIFSLGVPTLENEILRSLVDH